MCRESYAIIRSSHVEQVCLDMGWSAQEDELLVTAALL